MYSKFLAWTVVLAAAASPGALQQASAQTAGMLSFQGLINDDLGDPVTGSVNLEFRIFDAETLGNLVDMDGDGVVEDVIGQDVKEVLGVTATDGIISTKFGPVAPNAFDGTSRWLEVTVNSPDPPLSRVEMATAPATAEQVNKPGTGTEAITIDDATGNVGIGTSAPGYPLTFPNVVGEKMSLWGDSDSSYGFGIDVSTLVIHSYDSTNDITFGHGIPNSVSNPFVEAMRIGGDGDVGIGTSSPQGRLHVTGGPTILQSLTIQTQQAWQVPSFNNAWLNFGAPFSPAGYFKDSQGVVHLRGLVQGGNPNGDIFFLPAGFHPEFQEVHMAQTSLGPVRVDIKQDGRVTPTAATGTFLSLDGITFRAFP